LSWGFHGVGGGVFLAGEEGTKVEGAGP
jgi:hypothetical protein